MKYTHIPLWFAMAFFNFFTPSASATCYPNVSGVTPPSGGDTYYIYRQTRIIENTLSTDPDTVAIGRSLGNVKVEISASIQGSAGYNCGQTGGMLSKRFHPAFIISDIRDKYGAYPSRIPGIGITSLTIDGASFPATSFLLQFTGFRQSVITAEISFLKTGPLQSTGDILRGPFAYEIASANNQTLFEYRFSGNPVIPPPAKPTCTLQPIPTVPLGTHSMNRFTGQDTVTAPQDFDVVMTCAGGGAGSSIDATLTFTDNTNMANTSDALSLNTTHVRGVSVQILRNGSPVRFGPQNASSGSPNVHELGAIPQQGQGSFNYRIPLQARYKQTSSSVSGAGQANAEAILTLNYQ